MAVPLRKPVAADNWDGTTIESPRAMRHAA
jgi:hypothetical protein